MNDFPHGRVPTIPGPVNDFPHGRVPTIPGAVSPISPITPPGTLPLVSPTVGGYRLSPIGTPGQDIIEYIDPEAIRGVADPDEIDYLRLAAFVKYIVEAVSQLKPYQKTMVGGFYVGQDSIPSWKQQLREHPGYPRVMGLVNLARE